MKILLSIQSIQIEVLKHQVPFFIFSYYFIAFVYIAIIIYIFLYCYMHQINKL